MTWVEVVKQFPAYRLTDRKGYVYLLHCEFGYYKIGESINLRQRFRRLEKQYNFKWEVAEVLPTANCYGVEQKLIRHFRDKRIKHRRDWFQLSPSDIEYIKSAVGGTS